jgi:hypothetical protein
MYWKCNRMESNGMIEFIITVAIAVFCFIDIVWFDSTLKDMEE